MIGENTKGRRVLVRVCFIAIALSFIVLLFTFVVSSRAEKKEHSENANRLLSTIKYNYTPKENWPALKVAAAALLKRCPKILDVATHGEQLSFSYYPNGWGGVGARFELHFLLEPESEKALPARLLDEPYPNFGLVGGEKPGAFMFRPLSLWFCDVPNDMTIDEIIQAHEKKGIPFEEMTHFIPLKDIPPNSF